MVSSKRMGGLLGFEEAVSACVWPVAARYWVCGGEVRPDPKAGWETTTDKPLADRNLFLSFAKLGKQGDTLPERAILRWIGKRGLLELRDPDADKPAHKNQKPISLEEFREEACRAYESLTLFEAIASEDHDAIRPRIGPVGKLGEAANPYVYLDDQPIPMALPADGELDNHAVLLAAETGLEWFVESRLAAVSLSFDRFSRHPRSLEVYRPRLVINVPDLHSAIWYQFALFMGDSRPRKYCVICEGPIFYPRPNRETCSGRCRKVKSRQH